MTDYPKIDYAMEREGLEKVCPYTLAKGSKDSANPHRHEVRENKKIKDDITDYVGNTPIVRLSNIAKADGIECEFCKHILNSSNFYSG